MYGKLESLRGIAAILVVLYHSPWTWGAQRLAWFDRGYLLVDFFFILSGFVMCHAYHEKIVRGMSFRDYFALRVSRLYPLHIVILLYWVPYVLIKHWVAAQSGEAHETLAASNGLSFLSSLLLIQAWGFNHELSWNGPSWSISAELFAYLTFYAASVTIDRRGRWWVPAIVSLGTYAWLWSRPGTGFNFTFDYGCLRCLAGFNLGLVVYRLQQPVPLAFGWQSLLELAATVAAVICIGGASTTTGIAAVMVSFAIVVGVFSLPSHGMIGRLLMQSPMQSLGRWSYSIYLVHALVIAVATNVTSRVLPRELTTPSLLVAVVANLILLAIVIGISRWTFEHIERPARDWMRDRVQRRTRFACSAEELCAHPSNGVTQPSVAPG